MDKANDLYVDAVKSGQRNLPEPLYWTDMSEKLNLSWQKYCEQYPEDVKKDTPFNKYMHYMYQNF